MNEPFDVATWRIFNDSAIVRAVERPATVLKNAAASSRVIAGARSKWPGLRARGAEVIGAAAVTHIVLNIALGGPEGWQWLIVPGIAVGLAALMMAFRRSPLQ